jgi:type I restriction enzyme M protein
MTPQQIVNKLWNYCRVLLDDGLSYLDYVEQLTFLLFLKMAHERTLPPFNQPSVIPEKYTWDKLLSKDGDALEAQYRHTLEALGKEGGLLGLIFKKAQNKVQDPAKLRRLVADLINKEQWLALDADVKGEAYEGLLEKNASEAKGGAGQYFTPRPLIRAMVEVMRPAPGDTICDPASGTGGFLLAAHEYIVKHHRTMDRRQKKHLKLHALRGYELTDSVARLCAMNLMLHGVGPDGDEADLPVIPGDSLSADPGERYSMVLSNPPFGKKSSVKFVNADGDQESEDLTINRADFVASTSNKQLNFIQHIKTILAMHGRGAVVIPDNVLFEGGAGEIIRRRLLHDCDVHTLLRLPTGIFYAQGVKANVLFFDKKPASETPWTKKLWVYDLRTNMHFTLKTNPLQREDLDDFVACYKAENRDERVGTWSLDNPTGRWRAHTYEELMARDKANLDITWLKDEALEESARLPKPDVIASEIVEDIRAALADFEAIESVLLAAGAET